MITNKFVKNCFEKLEKLLKLHTVYTHTHRDIYCIYEEFRCKSL